MSVGLFEDALERLAVEQVPGGDDDARRCEDERDDHAGGQIEDGQTAVALAPAPCPHGVGQHEGHVDTHGSRGRRDEDDALFGQRLGRPEIAGRLVLDGSQHLLVSIARREDHAGIGNEAGKDPPERQSGLAHGQLGDDEDERHDDHADDCLHNGFVNADAEPTAAVEKGHQRHDGQDDQRREHLEAETVAVGAKAGEDILGQGTKGERVLRQDEYHVRDQGGKYPAPGQHRVDPGAHGLERALARGQGDVADGCQHDDAEDDCAGLDPQDRVTADDAQEQGARE